MTKDMFGAKLKLYRGLSYRSEKVYSFRSAITVIIPATKIKGGPIMSSEEAENLMEQFDKWDTKHAKQDFIARMGRKLYRKERSGRS